MGWISKYSKTLILYVAVTSAKELSGNRMGEAGGLAWVAREDWGMNEKKCSIIFLFVCLPVPAIRTAAA